MKKLLIGIGAVLLVLIAVALAAPFFIPAGVYKDQLVAQVKSATGRDLRIDGDVRLSLLPRLELEAERVALSNPPGAAEKDMATLQKLEVQLALLPLLAGEVAVDEFILVEPVIHLEIDKKGQPNWRFESAATAPPGTAPPAQGRPAEKGAPREASGGSGLAELRLGEVKIENGRITYLDQRSNARYEASDVDLAVKLPSLDQAVELDGALVWNGKRVELDAKADRARALLEATSTPIAVKLAAEPLALSITGTAALPAVSGELELKVPSLRALAAWTGHPLGPGEGLGPFSLSGKFNADTGRYAFANARLALDQIKGTGEVELDTTGVRPRLAAKLAVDGLDLNPYLGQPSGAVPAAGPGPAAPSGGTPPPAPSSPAPPAGGDAGWSDEPIDLAALRALDAELDLSATRIRYQKIAVDKGLLAVRLLDGQLDADLTDLALYKGNGSGKVSLAERNGAAALTLNFRLSGVDAEKLLADAAGFDKLRGTGEVALEAAGSGKSQRAIIGALDGKGSLALTNGALKGVDLARIARNLGGGEDATEFSELKGTFTIEDGLVRNNDLVLVSPVLRIEGAGTVDLPRRTVQYRLAPKGDLAQLGIGIIVQGPWTDLAYRPDLGNVPGRLLQGLDPRGQTAPGSQGPSTAPPKPGDILRGLLGK
jgi:AsmA protein